jgi:hypothetical protein
VLVTVVVPLMLMVMSFVGMDFALMVACTGICRWLRVVFEGIGRTQ